MQPIYQPNITFTSIMNGLLGRYLFGHPFFWIFGPFVVFLVIWFLFIRSSSFNLMALSFDAFQLQTYVKRQQIE